jgi:DNA repair exonuclease SbcCD ATPase subunit
MLVTLSFDKDGISYRIERGRRPNLLKFYVNDVEQDTEESDDAQGDMRETQKDVDELLGMSHDMFKHIVALNTYTEPFLSLKANDQRTIIEQLLGITLLSEKAEHLKELGKATKDAITSEEFRIKAVGDANKRIEEQIENLRKRQRMWQAKHNEDIARFQSAFDELSRIDIEAELAAHLALTAYNDKAKQIKELTAWIKRCELDEARETKTIEKLKADSAQQQLEMKQDYDKNITAKRKSVYEYFKYG